MVPEDRKTEGLLLASLGACQPDARPADERGPQPGAGSIEPRRNESLPKRPDVEFSFAVIRSSNRSKSSAVAISKKCSSDAGSSATRLSFC